MRVALLNNLFVPYRRGGAEVVVERLATALVALGHQVIILSTKPYRASESLQFASHEQGFTREYWPSLYHFLGHWPKALRLLWQIGQWLPLGRSLYFVHWLRARQIDLLITNNLQGLGYDLLGATGKLNLRSCHILHDAQLLHPSGLILVGQEKLLDSRVAQLFQKLNRQRSSRIDLVISPSHWLYEEHLQRGFFVGVSNLILPNPSATTVLSPERRGQIENFLFVGQLNDHKGVSQLVTAFQELIKVKPEASLTLVGSGPLLPWLRGLEALAPWLKVTGGLAPDKVQELMLRADCLVIPSLCYENSPNVFFESLAVGLPVLGSDLGGLRELLAVGQSAALVFEPSAEAILEKLVWAMEQSEALRAAWQTVVKRQMILTAAEYLNRLFAGLSKKMA